MVKDRKLISISSDIVEKLNKRYQIDDKNTSFPNWVNEYLSLNLERDDFLRDYAPYISKIGITDNTLFLKDSKENKVIEIRLVNGRLQSSDENPIYVQYAMALPELVKLKKHQNNNR